MPVVNGWAMLAGIRNSHPNGYDETNSEYDKKKDNIYCSVVHGEAYLGLFNVALGGAYITNQTASKGKRRPLE